MSRRAAAARVPGAALLLAAVGLLGPAARAEGDRPAGAAPPPDVPPAAAAAPGAAAPPGEGGVLSLGLAEVLERARAASPGLQRLRLLRDGADAAVRAARAGGGPEVDLGASYTRLSGVPVLQVGLPPPQGTTTIFPNLPDRYASRLGLSLPLLTGGRLKAQRDAAARERDAAGREVDLGEADLLLEAALAYWDLLTTRAAQHVLEEAVAAYDAHLQDARNRFTYGVAARNEVLQVQVERDQAELARLQEAAQARAAQAAMARLLLLPPEATVEPTDALAPLPRAAESLPDLVRQAIAARPDRAALEARAEAAEARIRTARADRLPQVRLSAGYDYSDPNPRILPLAEGWRDTWDASLSLSVPLFDSGRAGAAMDQQSALAAAARKGVEGLDAAIRQEVTDRFLELTTADASVDLSWTILEAARENNKVAADRYRAGVIPSSERLDAETALLRAGLDRTGALARQLAARARLDRATGRRP